MVKIEKGRESIQELKKSEKYGKWVFKSCGFFLLVAQFLVACASSGVTKDLSQGAADTVKWELVTVQPGFMGKSDFLAVTELDGQVLDKPLVFGIDVVLLSLGEHQLKLQLGRFESWEELLDSSARSEEWRTELGTITLREPKLEKPAKGRNYLVASYDNIYASNSNSPEFIQRWVVNYPRTFDAEKKWSIESLSPAATTDLSPDLQIETNEAETNEKKAASSGELAE